MFQHWKNPATLQSRRVSACDSSSRIPPLENRIAVLDLLQMLVSLNSWNLVLDSLQDVRLQGRKDKEAAPGNKNLKGVLQKSWSKLSLIKLETDSKCDAETIASQSVTNQEGFDPTDSFDWFMMELESLVAEKSREWSGQTQKARNIFVYARNRGDLWTVIRAMPATKVDKALERHAVTVLVSPPHFMLGCSIC